MLIRQNYLEVLDYMDVSNAKVLCLCPICGELSDILNSDAILDDVICGCAGTMEILLVEIPQEGRDSELETWKEFFSGDISCESTQV